MAYTYPSNDLQQPRRLLGLLGSFWTQTYQGKQLVQRICQAVGERLQQSLSDLNEAVAQLSRLDVPVYHTELWQPLRLLQSEQGQRLPRYDDGYVYNGSPQLYYDLSVQTGRRAWALPEGLAAVQLLCNRQGEPTAALAHGTDFHIDLSLGEIVFRQDPFASEEFAQQPVLEDGVETDRELVLWMFRPQYDREFVYRHWGYVIDLQLESSELYRTLLNALLDALTQGSSKRLFADALAAMTGIPLVKEDSETVELVRSWTRYDGTELLSVLTDVHHYDFVGSPDALVSVGDVVPGSGPLCAALRIEELHRGALPEGVDVLSLGRGFLLGGPYLGELTFANADKALEVETDDEGFTRVSFELGGFPLDVEAFWDLVHSQGLARGQTLAQLLDVRSDPPDEPGPESLPATINPLEFLVENVLRHNAYLVRLQTASVRADAPGLGAARFLRRLLPPHTASLFLVELPALSDSATLDNYEESIDTGHGLDTQVDEIDAAVYAPDGLLGARLNSGVCQ